MVHKFTLKTCKEIALSKRNCHILKYNSTVVKSEKTCASTKHIPQGLKTFRSSISTEKLRQVRRCDSLPVAGGWLYEKLRPKFNRKANVTSAPAQYLHVNQIELWVTEEA